MNRLSVLLLLSALLPCLPIAARAADLPGDPYPTADPYGSSAGSGGWIGGADVHLAPDPAMAPAPAYSAPAAPATAAGGTGGSTGGVVAGKTVTLPGGRVTSAANAAMLSGQPIPAAAAPQPVPYNAGWENDHSPRREFARRSGFPEGRPGYVIDYIVPLRAGGSKSSDNMRWVPVDDASAAR
jgi:hypothetical protein